MKTIKEQLTAIRSLLRDKIARNKDTMGEEEVKKLRIRLMEADKMSVLSCLSINSILRTKPRFSFVILSILACKTRTFSCSNSKVSCLTSLQEIQTVSIEKKQKNSFDIFCTLVSVTNYWKYVDILSIFTNILLKNPFLLKKGSRVLIGVSGGSILRALYIYSNKQDTILV